MSENSPFEDRVRQAVYSFPFRKRAFLAWRDDHRHRLARVFLKLDALLDEPDAERVKALLREEL